MRRAHAWTVLLLLCCLVAFSTTAAGYRENLDLLLVDDSHRAEYANSNQSIVVHEYASALNEYDIPYDVHWVGNNTTNNARGPSAAKMKQYNTVIWFTGTDTSGAQECSSNGNGAGCRTIYQEDANNIEEYLDSGGRLFLTGQYIDNEVGDSNLDWRQELYNQYLRSYSVDYDGSGNPEPDQLFGTFSDNGLLAGDGDQTRESGDDRIGIDPKSDLYRETGYVVAGSADGYRIHGNDEEQTGESIFYDESVLGGSSLQCETNGYGFPCEGLVTTRDDLYKTVYMTTGFEIVENSQNVDQSAFMRRTIDYLSGPLATYPGSNNIRFANLTERDDMEFDARCNDNQYQRHGDGIIAASMVINSSVVNNQDDIEQWDQQSPISMDAESYSSFDQESAYVTKNPYDVSSHRDDGKQLGVNATAFIHCKDENRPTDASGEGYWGPFETWWFVLDTVAPPSTDANPPLEVSFPAAYEGNLTDDRTPTIQLTKNDVYSQAARRDIHEFRLSCDGASWGGWRTIGDTSAMNVTDFNLDTGPGCTDTDGKKTVHVQVRDRAGNIEGATDGSLDTLTSRTFTVWLDTTDPVLAAQDPANDTSIQPVNLRLGITDALTEPGDIDAIDQTIRFSGGPNRTFHANTSFDPQWPTSGELTPRVWLSDRAGNTISTQLEYLVDPFRPDVGISPSNGSFIAADDRITVTASDNLTSIGTSWYDADGTNTSFTPGTGFDPGWTTETTHTLRLWINDTVGNMFTDAYEYTLDDTPPALVDQVPSNDSAVQSSDTLSVSWTDDGSGVRRTLRTLDGSNYSFGGDINYTTTFDERAEGYHWYRWWAFDHVDNKDTWWYRYLVDDTAPDVHNITPITTYINEDDDLTVTFGDPQSPNASGISTATIDVGGGPLGLTNGSAFDPGWTQDGSHSYEIVLEDVAGNRYNVSDNYILDTLAPSISSIVGTVDGRFLNASGRITVNVDDDGAGDQFEPSGLGPLAFDSDGTNDSFTSGTAFDPTLPSEGNTTVAFWLEDEAGNLHRTEQVLTLDTTAPTVDSVDPANTSFITSDEELTFTVSDQLSGVDTLLYDSTGTNTSFTSGSGFDPGWTTETTHTVTIWSNDSVGNLVGRVYEYSVDDTAPRTHANHTAQPWQSVNASVELNCVDADYANSCEAITYCTGDGCSPSTQLSDPSTIGVGVVDGREQNITLRYRSTDLAGNMGTVNTSYVPVDKRAPEITFDNPSNNSQQGGNITFRTTISDGGSGVSLPTYRIINRSDGSTVTSGTVGAGSDSVVWNSSSVESGSFLYEVTANDTLSNVRTRELFFTVDNRRPSIDVADPSDRFYNSDVPVSIDISRQGEDLANATYYIYNSTGVEQFDQSTAINQQTFSFSDTFDVGPRADGNYSLNVSAYDTQGKRTTFWTWFIVDRDAPDVSITDPVNESWQSGTVQFQYSVSDQHIDDDACSSSSSDDGGAWSFPTSRSCSGSSFSFGTGKCDDDTAPDCRVRVQAQDRAGNTAEDIRYLRIDNSLPDVSIPAPAGGAWFNGDFSVNLTTLDPQGLDSAAYRVNSSGGDSGWTSISSPAGSRNVTVDVSNWCPVDGVRACNVTLRADNNPQDRAITSRQFSLDRELPTLSINRYADGANITPSDSFLLSYGDGLSGVMSAQYARAGTNSSMPSGSPFTPGFQTQGTHDLTFWITDRAGNVLQRQNSYNVDLYDPAFHSVQPANTTNISGTDTITAVFGDNFTGVRSARYDIGNGFVNVFANRTAFEPSWSGTGERTIRLRLTDHADRQTTDLYQYYLDSVLPTVMNATPDGGSTIAPRDIRFDVYDAGTGIRNASFTHGDLSGYQQFTVNQSFDPGWTTEGDHTVDLRIYDRVDNLRTKSYTYTIDNSTPDIGTVSLNRSFVSQGDVLKITAGVSDTYADVKNATAILINASSGATITEVPLSDTAQGWAGTYTGGTGSGRVDVNVTAYDETGFRARAQKARFTLDNQAPELVEYEFNTSLDARFGDHRIFRGSALRFTANITDAAPVTLTKVQVGTASKNISLSGSPLSFRFDSSSKINTGTDRRVNLTRIWLNDSVGNAAAVPLIGANGTFRVVSPVTNITPTSTDAHENTSVTLWVDANRSYAGTIEVFIPPSTKGSITDPVFTNITDVTCDDCNLSYQNRSGHVAALSAETADGVVPLQGTFTAPAPATDTGYTFRGRIAGFKRTASMDVLAPNLSVSRVWCAGPRCTVNQSQVRDITVSITNTNGGGLTGDAVDTRVSVEIGNRSEADGPAIASGSTVNVTLPVNATQAGNTTAAINVSVLGSYRASNDTAFHVIDTAPPTISRASLEEDITEFYRNESVSMSARVQDNLAARSTTFTIVHPAAGGGNTTTNISASADSAFPTDATWSTVFNDTDRSGDHAIDAVWAADNYSNMQYTDLNITFSVIDFNLSVGTDVTGTAQVEDTVVINASAAGNRTSITDANATILKPGGVTERLDMEAFGADPSTLRATYDNVTRSGNYTVNVSVDVGKLFWNTTEFQVEYGQLNVSPVYLGDSGQIDIPQNTTFSASWLFEPVQGDVQNVTAVTSGGQALTVQSSSQDLGNVTYEQGRELADWTISSDPVGSDTSSYLAVNATSTRPATSSVDNTTVTVVTADTTDPTVPSVAPVFDKINLGQQLRFYATVSDNSIIREAVLQVNATNVTAQNVTLSAVGTNNVSGTFTPTTAGNYTYRVFVEDIAGNVGVSANGTFEAVEDYTVTIGSDAAQYRKDSLIEVDLNVTDVNGRRVTGFNSTVIMDRNGTLVTLLPDNRTDDTEYVVRPEDPPTAIGVDKAEYTFDANVSKAGNTGEATLSVPVYQILNMSFLEPDNGEFIPAGTEFDVIVRVRSIQGDPVDALSYVVCEACTTNFRYLEENSSGVYYQAKAFVSPDGFPVLPIRAYADDFQGNTQPMIDPPNSDPRSAVQVSVNTVSTSQSSPSGGGGGGGGGGGFGAPSLGISRLSPPAQLPPTAELANVSVSTQQQATCQYVRNGTTEQFDTTGGTLHWVMMTVTAGATYNIDVTCSDGQVSQTLESFVFSVASEVVESYDLSIGDFEQELVQGQTGALPISFFNNGTAPISISLAANSSCCSTAFIDSSGQVSEITVGEASERSISFQVAVPLNVDPGSYDADLRFEQAGRVRERTVTFQVSQSQLVRQLLQLRQAADELNRTIQQYAEAGIDTTSMRNRYNELRRFISLGEQAIRSDDAALLQNAVESGQDRESSIRGQIRAQSFKRYVLETWWQWLIGAFLLYTLFFMITMVTVPYYRMRTQLINIKEQLDSATEARKNAEKQYFRREIDRSTFMDIMTTRQDEILELRGDKEELEEDLETAIRDLMSIERFVKAPIMFVRELNRWIEARRTEKEED